MFQTRRTFITNSVAAGSLAGGSMIGAASLVASGIRGSLPGASAASSPIALADGATILFQGDSITDAGRSRETQDTANDFAMLGNGYAKLIAYHLLSRHDGKHLRIFNRGISGHKVPNLDERWQRDTIDLKPDVLSILIGVNDIWHKLGGNYDGTVETYRTGFAALLGRTRDALPHTTLVVCEPFVLRCGAVNDRWFPEFDERRAAARDVATEAGAIFVPFQAMFDAAVAAGSDPKVWAGDGVHPSAQGAALMAMRWLGETGLA
ncbi:MAG: SGNH/GDSL hydrolase family protein [Phycisphaerales bacterium]|nr:SGNH/GDSL hydrolase family protein [Phycisphaerales bacterium]